jgi:hypothetical protein
MKYPTTLQEAYQYALCAAIDHLGNERPGAEDVFNDPSVLDPEATADLITKGCRAVARDLEIVHSAGGTIALPA